jgi:hypothetical protein
MGLLFPIHGKYMQCSKPPTSFRDVLRCDNSCRAIVIRLVIKLSYIYQYVDLVKLVFFWNRRHSEAQAIFACPRRVIRWKSTGRLYHYWITIAGDVTIYSDFSNEQLWFSIVMLVYQRVSFQWIAKGNYILTIFIWFYLIDHKVIRVMFTNLAIFRWSHIVGHCLSISSFHRGWGQCHLSV